MKNELSSKERETLLSLGHRIASIRGKKNISQLSLSLKAGVSKSYLSDLENGRRNPSVLVLDRIASALKTPLSSLFEKEENNFVL